MKLTCPLACLAVCGDDWPEGGGRQLAGGWPGPRWPGLRVPAYEAIQAICTIVHYKSSKICTKDSIGSTFGDKQQQQRPPRRLRPTAHADLRAAWHLSPHHRTARQAEHASARPGLTSVQRAHAHGGSYRGGAARSGARPSRGRDPDPSPLRQALHARPATPTAISSAAPAATMAHAQSGAFTVSSTTPCGRRVTMQASVPSSSEGSRLRPTLPPTNCARSIGRGPGGPAARRRLVSDEVDGVVRTVAERALRRGQHPQVVLPHRRVDGRNGPRVPVTRCMCARPRAARRSRAKRPHPGAVDDAARPRRTAAACPRRRRPHEGSRPRRRAGRACFQPAEALGVGEGVAGFSLCTGSSPPEASRTKRSAARELRGRRERERGPPRRAAATRSPRQPRRPSSCRIRPGS